MRHCLAAVKITSKIIDKYKPTKLQGGAIVPMFPGDKIAPFTPSRPNAAYQLFVDNVLRHIGTGLNLPTELLRKF